MTRVRPFTSSISSHLFCLLLSYSLILSTIAPFIVRNAKAANERHNAAPPKASAPQTKGGRRDGQVLVRFRDGVSLQDKQVVVSSLGAKGARRLRGSSSAYLINLSAGLLPETAVAQLLLNPVIQVAEPNYLISQDEVETKGTSLLKEAALRNGSEAIGKPSPNINSSQTTPPASATVIAVIDSGIDFSHPDLINHQWKNAKESANGRDDDGNGYVDDTGGASWVGRGNGGTDASGHGTRVAGVIIGANSSGGAEATTGLSLMSLRVLDSTGTGDVASAVEAIDYAVMMGASVINCSWGTDENSSILRDAIERAGKLGVLIVSSAGNLSRDIDSTPYYPSSYGLSNVLVVASTGNDGNLSSWSNWGVTHVQVAASGDSILTTARGGSYEAITGTSASAALASRVAGLVKADRPFLSAERTRGVIVAGATPVAALKDKVSSGGVINAGGTMVQVNALPPNEGKEKNTDTGNTGNGNNGAGIGTGNGGNNVIPSPAPEKVNRTQGAPGVNLPNLDLMRSKKGKDPKAPDPIPSTRRRCPPKNPNCSNATATPSTPVLAHPVPPIIPPVPQNKIGYALPDDNVKRYAPVFFASLNNNWLADLFRLSNLFDSPFPQNTFLQPASNYFEPSAIAPMQASSTPYTSLSVPGTIEVEYFDNGGEGVAYHDTTAGSHGQDYDQPPSYPPPSLRQPTDVDIYKSSGYSNGYLIVMQAGDWMNYTVDVWMSGTYTFEAKTYYWGAPGGTFHVEVDGVNKTGQLQLPGGSSWQTVTKTGIQLTAGRHVLKVVADTNGSDGNYMGDIDYIRFTDPINGMPYSISSGVVPGTIEAELYNEGGSGVAYYDTTPSSHGQDYDQPPSYPPPSFRQPTDVDIYKQTGNYSNNYLVMMQAGDWMKYTINVAATGLYTLEAKAYYWGTPGGTFHVEVDGVDKTGQLQLAGGNSWQTVTKDGIQLTAGGHVLKVVCDTNGSDGSYMGDIDYIRFVGAPYSGTPISIPGNIEAEYYDNGGQSFGYYDTSPGSHGQDYNQPPNYPPPSFRQPTDVDIYKSAGYSSGYLVVMQAGDWMSYTVNVATSGTYTLEALVAWGTYAGGTFHVELDGTNATGPIQIPNTNWALQTITGPSLSLSAGRHRLRIVADTNAPNGATGDIDYIRFTGTGISDPSGDNYSKARIDPFNRTGEAGEDLLSGNYNWSLPVVSLPGRAGLDLGLSLSYNSLVWTKDVASNSIKFDADEGFPSPGFRLGFPVIQSRYVNAQGINSYLMITPSGSRVELRQAGSSTTYEAADSSYLQLIDYGSSLLVRSTDGTQLLYQPSGSDYQCTQIKDRNGNYISASYDGLGNITSVIDTLGRVITFNYDTYQNLISITQSWRRDLSTGTVQETHTWASFGWTNLTVNTGFTGLTQVGVQNNQTIPVINQVGLPDGSTYNFEYNNYGQVFKITHNAGRPLAYNSYNMPSNTSDCPRVTERHDWAENWNNQNEVVTYLNTVAGGYSPAQATLPDGTIYKEQYALTGWQRGLVTGTEFWSNGVKKKWTTSAWTQDDESLSYRLNPRVTETNIYDDAGNRRRTTVSYTSFGLPSDVYEYGADATTVYRRSHTDYNLDTAYTSRRIIGLVWEQKLYDGAGNLFAKANFYYDWNYGDYFVDQPGAVQHDVNYSHDFYYGRGNLSVIRRWDVNSPTNGDAASDTRIGYNTNGSVIFEADANWHRQNFIYTDSFSDAVNHNTFAYPTTITDPDGFQSFMQYNYSFGAVTRTQGIAPAGQTTGAIQLMDYDAAGRTQQIKSQNNNAYTRFVYDPSLTFISSFSTIRDVNTEAFSGVGFDGAGRLRSTQQELPGSLGGYVAQITGYDVMGRVSTKSNPAEINANWIPSGDDALGWVWTTQAYDWKGRPTVTTNPDSTTRENTYGGCGCAGGEQVTAKDERGRRRRMAMDVLGRLRQVDELNWDGSVYSTTLYSYNARDQIIGINQAGLVRSFEYDGHGRLSSRTTPEQGTTTYTYNADDTVSTVADARGATQNFSYNSRHLVTGINYGGAAGVAPTANVTFSYDAAGNRTLMTDAQGSTSYVYDSLSELTQETRTFNNLGSYTISYGYGLGGQLTNITNPWSAEVGYSYDNVGRVTGVAGANYAGVSTYASGLQYRAFSGLKAMTYGNGRQLSMQYDSRMRTTKWDVSSVLGFNYYYNYFSENTGRVTFAQNLYDSTLDRSYDYDHVGRLLDAHTGSEARGHIVGQGGTLDGPYSQSYRYDQWGNMTYRVGWGGLFGSWTEQWPQYANNRLVVNPQTGATMQYDASGNLINDGYQSYQYDAVGRQSYASGTNLSQSYDGDGLRIAKTENAQTTYYLRSSVLGGEVVAEINGSGGWQRGYVYLGSELLAIQSGGVHFVHQDPVAKSQRVTDINGTVESWIELDPWGGETSRSANVAMQPRRFTTYERDGNGSDEAMMRRYDARWNRFSQPDPYSGSYDLSNPQSFNRYSYTHSDPVNFSDPSGLLAMDCFSGMGHSGGEAIWGRLYCYALVNDWWNGPKGEPGDGAEQPHEESHEQQSHDPCAHLLPANIPPNVNTDALMKEVREIYRDMTTGIQDLGATAARGAMPFTIFGDFYRRVRSGGPWDFKWLDQEGIRQTGRSKYEEFGNFIYGATGASLGIPEGALLRGAGYAQQQDPSPDVRALGRGVPVNSWGRIFSNDGTYPYGDEPQDAEAIQRGIEYYNCRRENPR